MCPSACPCIFHVTVQMPLSPETETRSGFSTVYRGVKVTLARPLRVAFLPMTIASTTYSFVLRLRSGISKDSDPEQDIVMVTSPDSSMDLHPALRVLPTDSTVTVPRVSLLVNVTAGASGLPQGFASPDCLEGWLQFTLLCDCTVAL